MSPGFQAGFFGGEPRPPWVGAGTAGGQTFDGQLGTRRAGARASLRTSRSCRIPRGQDAQAARGSPGHAAARGGFILAPGSRVPGAVGLEDAELWAPPVFPPGPPSGLRPVCLVPRLPSLGCLEGARGCA